MNDKEETVYAMLDGGANRVVVSGRLADMMNMETDTKKVSLYTVEGVTCGN